MAGFSQLRNGWSLIKPMACHPNCHLGGNLVRYCHQCLPNCHLGGNLVRYCHQCLPNCHLGGNLVRYCHQCLPNCHLGGNLVRYCHQCLPITQVCLSRCRLRPSFVRGRGRPQVGHRVQRRGTGTLRDVLQAARARHIHAQH